MVNDLISRQAAIYAICKEECESGYCGTSCNYAEAIEQLPPAQQWIPVTERFPKEGNRYIIYHESYGIRIDARIHGEWKTYGDETVLAWMPLPEPYSMEMDK